MGILGMKTTDAGGLPATAPRGREAERILAAELLAEFRHLSQTMTNFTERFAGRIVNHTLLVETVTFDSAATPVTRAWHVAAGCIEVSNPGDNTVTVSSAGPSSAAPTAGVGVYVVPAGTTRVVALASTQVTLYGTAADTVSVQVFTAPAQPVAV